MIEKKFNILTIVSLITLLVLFVIIDKSNSVPVIANESIIDGVVSEYAIVASRLIDIKPEQILYRLTINIESSANVGDEPNFLNDKKGKDIRFYSKEKLSSELFGKRVKAKARYRGNERGGLYWISNIEVIK